MTVLNGYKLYSKKDFLNYASSFDYYAKEEAKFKKMKIEDFRNFYGFTHKNEITGQERDYRNYACLDCLSILSPDLISNKNKYFCLSCL